MGRTIQWRAECGKPWQVAGEQNLSGKVCCDRIMDRFGWRSVLASGLTPPSDGGRWGDTASQESGTVSN